MIFFFVKFTKTFKSIAFENFYFTAKQNFFFSWKAKNYFKKIESVKREKTCLNKIVIFT